MSNPSGGGTQRYRMSNRAESNHDIFVALQDLTGRLENTYLTRREHDEFSKNIGKSFDSLRESFDDLSKALRLEYTPRREFDDQVQQIRSDRDALRSDIKSLRGDLDTVDNRTSQRFLGNANQSVYYLFMLLTGVAGYILAHLVH